MLGRTDSRVRMVAIMLVFAVIAGAAGLRLGYWQVVAAEDLTAQVREVLARNEAASQKIIRADIVDRDGVMLAKTSSFDAVVAHPNLMDPEEDAALVEVLGALLDLDHRERLQLTERLRTSRDDGDKWLSLVPEITLAQSAEVGQAIDDDILEGLVLEPRDVRHYPRNGGEPGTSLASHLLGFVRADGRGGEGVESYYDDELTTIDPGLVDIATIEGMAIGFEGVDPPPLELTIDAKLQKQVEKELHTARTANQAKSASAIVMDPHTGAILASATVPSYDAEDYAAVASRDMSKLRNRVFSDQFEPGSVMKIFTVTAALDLGLVTPHTVIRDEKQLQFWKYTVRNADRESKGDLSVKDVIARSRNVATAKIARMLAPNSTQKAAHRLYDLWKKVGMTRPTGADIANEITGNWYDPDVKQWAPIDLANRAFGQGVAVTMPQLARGTATLVNGGYLVQPHLVKDAAVGDEKERVLKAKVARQAKEIMTHVTGSLPWYAAGSLIPGYEIGGKTGTAQIWDSAKGKWKQRRFNHNFIGFVAGRKQEYVVIVRLEEPKPIYVKQGDIPLRIESYELFQMVARSTINQLNMKKSKDPNAGRPIIGTDAAKRLEPTRNRQVQQAQKKAKAQAARKAKAEAAKSSKGSEKASATASSQRAGAAGSEGT